MKERLLKSLKKKQMRAVIETLSPDNADKFKKATLDKCYNFLIQFNYKEITKALDQ